MYPYMAHNYCKLQTFIMKVFSYVASYTCSQITILTKTFHYVYIIILCFAYVDQGLCSNQVSRSSFRICQQMLFSSEK